jgi:recombinational DNA repair protein (RecF pathway)
MNNIQIIYEYDKIMNRLGDEIKNSNYKIQYFLDLLDLKRSFFYKKLKEKRFTSAEMIKLSKSLFPDEYNQYEVDLINKLIDRSKEEIKNNKGKDFELLLDKQKGKYGL